MGGTCFFQEDVRQLLLEETVQRMLLTVSTVADWRPSLSSDRGHKQEEASGTAASATLILQPFFFYIYFFSL